ncbi:Lcl domain-containing protein [Parabacteroides sp.]
MKRINKILLIVLLSLSIGTTILQAQTVTTVTLGGKQYPVIDLTELTPLGCVLTKKECDERRAAMYANNINPSSTSLISINGTDGAWNKKMSSKFQIMKGDYSNNATWVEAWNGCKAYTGSSDGGGSQAGQWRLPTQKEFEMIFLLYPQLLEDKLMSAFGTGYWHATENNKEEAWNVNFINGITAPNKKVNGSWVRCIRDL